MKKELKRFFRSPSAVIGVALLLFLVFIGLFGVKLAPYSPYAQDLPNKLLPPGAQNLMGTDEFGRDVFSRMLAGTKYSLSAGLVSVAVGLLGGLLIGIPAGYTGKWLDKALMTVCDIMLAFPGILMAMAISMVLGPGIYTPMIAVGISSIPVFARLIRAEFMSLRDSLFVEAVRAAGAGGIRISLLHILPNAIGPVLIQATLRMGVAIITSATLSFLGLGAQPPEPEWGAMLNAARDYFWQSPYLAVFPGLAITVTVIAINLVGDALRDHFDPKLRRA